MVSGAGICHKAYAKALDTALTGSGAVGKGLFFRNLVCSLVFQMYQGPCKPLES